MKCRGEGCGRFEKYRLEIPSGRRIIWRSPSLQLVMLLDRQDAADSTTMKLTAIETRGLAVVKALNWRREYGSDNPLKG